MLLLSAELMVQLHCLLMVFGRVLCDKFFTFANHPQLS